MNTTPNTTANGTTDLTAEIEYNCLAAWNRSEFGANQHDTVHPMYLTAFKSGYKAALAASAPVAPAPQPAVPAGYVLVPVEPTLTMLEAARKHDYENPTDPTWGGIYSIMLAAAPKAAPAINKVSDIIDAYGMTPGQPERVADIPGLAEALEAAFADGLAQVTGAAPPHQGEYLPLPQPDTHCYDEDTCKDVWSHSAEQMRAYLDAHLAARGAAQAAPAPVAEDAALAAALAAAPKAAPKE